VKDGCWNLIVEYAVSKRKYFPQSISELILSTYGGLFLLDITALGYISQTTFFSIYLLCSCFIIANKNCQKQLRNCQKPPIFGISSYGDVAVSSKLSVAKLRLNESRNAEIDCQKFVGLVRL